MIDKSNSKPAFIIADNEYNFIGVLHSIKSLNQKIKENQLIQFYLIDFNSYKEYVVSDVKESINKSFEELSSKLVKYDPGNNFTLEYTNINTIDIKGTIVSVEYLLALLPKYPIFMNDKTNNLKKIILRLTDAHEKMLSVHYDILENSLYSNDSTMTQDFEESYFMIDYKRNLKHLTNNLLHSLGVASTEYLHACPGLKNTDLSKYIKLENNPHVFHFTGTNDVKPFDKYSATFRPVQNGIFLVNQFGDVLRKQKDNTYTLANQTIILDRYWCVTAMVNNKQELYYTHRLVAEAFIENPDNKDKITFADGDSMNIHVDNLIRATAKELSSMNTLEINGVPCPRCGELMLYGPVCSACKQDLTALKGRLRTRKKIKEPIRKAFNNIEKYKPRNQVIIRRRFRGNTLSEISDYLGVTHQYISMLLKQIVEDHPSVFIKK